MTPLAHGIDIVPVDRIERLLDQHGPRFLDRCFTPHEREVCLGHARAAERLAARFAAKEAAFKALGTGWSGGIAWTDAEVVTQASGAPALVLHAAAAERAAALGITAWFVSLSHAGGMAVASVIGVGPG
ncbi:MAG: holo-ACP synthase [Phycisphaerales bacterium]|nr:holo-ACP synthase [Phycisphaerales bacterium]